MNLLDEPVDYILLAGQRSPGLAEVVGAGTPRKWDERKGYALSGATLIYRGLELAKFSVKLRLYTAEHWRAWDDWSPIVKRAPVGVHAKHLEIWHPILQDLGIHSVGVVDQQQPVQTTDGEWTIEIKFIEHREIRLALAQPEGSRNAPVDPVQQRIDNLNARNAVNRATLQALAGPP